MKKGIDFERLALIGENRFLEENFFFDFNEHNLGLKVKELIEGLNSQKEKAIALFNFVRDEIPYTMHTGFFPEINYKASVILKRGKGFCIQKAVLLTAMLRGAGIPSAIGFADIVNYKIPKEAYDFLGTNYFSYHGFTVLKLNGKWLKATPTFDRETCKKAGYPLLEFDGERDCVFPQYCKDGSRFIEYKKYYGVFFEIPFKDIIESWEGIYGKETVKHWKIISQVF